MRFSASVTGMGPHCFADILSCNVITNIVIIICSFPDNFVSSLLQCYSLTVSVTVLVNSINDTVLSCNLNPFCQTQSNFFYSAAGQSFAYWTTSNNVKHILTQSVSYRSCKRWFLIAIMYLEIAPLPPSHSQL